MQHTNNIADIASAEHALKNMCLVRYLFLVELSWCSKTLLAYAAYEHIADNASGGHVLQNSPW